MDQQLLIIEKMRENERFFQSKYKEIQEKHENEFVAIDDEKIVANEKTFNDVMGELKNQKRNVALILIEFVPKKGLKIIL